MTLEEIGFTEEVMPRHISREGIGAALRPVSRRGHHPRARDEIHGRGDGHRHGFRPGLLQEPARRAAGRAREGHGVHQREGRRTRRSSPCPWRTSFTTSGFSIISTSGTAAFLQENGIARGGGEARVSEGGTDLLEQDPGGQRSSSSSTRRRARGRARTRSPSGPWPTAAASPW